ncbi:MAG: stage II sporulation protein M [Bacteroidia bacterium]
MKESSFISQNKDNWKHYEKVLNGQSTEPDELHDLFIQVTDDLSYSRSFYPNRSVRVYLNSLAQKVFLKLYTNRRRKHSFLGKFFKDDLPAILFSARKELLVCFLVFMLSFTVGVFSSRHQPGFARQILGNQYVEMTNKNIKEGKPMNVYAGGDKLYSFLWIAKNNLTVDLLSFATGLLFAIGTLFVLAYNGVMVGVFQYFFYGTGYFTFTVLTIWLHGTLEIFTIILSATAGLVFGKGLVFPGTYSRVQAFRISAIKGVKILFVVIPLTLTAAFIEAFITGQSGTPLYLKASLIIVSLFFILFYFVWLPWLKFSKTGLHVEENELPMYTIPKLVVFEIKTVGEIVADMFRVWKKQLAIIVPLSLGLSIALVLGVYFVQARQIQYQMVGGNVIFNVLKLLKINVWFRDGYYSLWPVLIVAFSLFTVFFQYYFFSNHVWQYISLKAKLSRFIGAFIFIFLALGSFFFCDGFWFFVLYFFIVFPICISITSDVFSNKMLGIGNGVIYFFNTFFSKLLLNFTLLILLFIFYLFVSSPILNLIIEVISNGLKLSDPVLFEIEKITVLVLGMASLLMIIPLFIYGNTLHYFSAKEKLTASTLRTSLEKIW